MSSLFDFAKFMVTPFGELGEVDTPFDEVEHTKEECYALCRKTLEALEREDCGPYTLFEFKNGCNEIARRGGNWKEYVRHCTKYLEVHICHKRLYKIF